MHFILYMHFLLRIRSILHITHTFYVTYSICVSTSEKLGVVGLRDACSQVEMYILLNLLCENGTRTIKWHHIKLTMN